MRVGVTGIFASGKGTVCEMFRELGAVLIDTDVVAREITEPGSPGLIEIVKVFGKEFLTPQGALDRRRFGIFVFQDNSRVEKLNAITHPLILDIIIERSPDKGITMINTPLLFESGFDKFMDQNIVVTAGSHQVLERGTKRDKITEDEIKQRLNYQIPLKEKIKLADYVIDNTGSLDYTRRQVVELWNILKDISSR